MYKVDSLMGHWLGSASILSHGALALPKCVHLQQLALKAVLLISFLSICFCHNWLNADTSQNCKNVDKSISSVPSVLLYKYCYLGNTKQVPPQLKLKNLLLLMLLCGDVALTLAQPISDL